MTLTAARVLTPAGPEETPLAIAGGVVVDAPAGREVALSGCTVLPGIVDLHGDGFERHLAPRRGLVSDLARGLSALDAELAASGITTAVLAQFWSWEGGMRSPDFARKLAASLAEARPHLLTDMVIQLRLETHLVGQFAEVAEFVERHGIGYVVYNDHLPHEALRKGRNPPRLTGQALKSGRSPEAHLALIRELAARGPEVPGALAELSQRFAAMGVQLGSHDDPDPERRAMMRGLGVRISEFPETMEAARAARDAGDAVILGAPNVVRGGSHAGKMDARAAVAEGFCDALVSDYHYPAPAAAAAALDPAGGGAGAWDLLSAGPARIMGWTDRGILAPGQRADLAILGPSGQIEAAIAAGRIAFARGAVAQALFG
nr:alpha-D-ribose 1-methylphosphonate 5-triphosphate diphosphatase [Mangrovicoccus sp. HB161399]